MDRGVVQHKDGGPFQGRQQRLDALDQMLCRERFLRRESVQVSPLCSESPAR